MNQRYLGGKRDSRRQSTTGFSENVDVVETSYRKNPKISPSAYIFQSLVCVAIFGGAFL